MSEVFIPLIPVAIGVALSPAAIIQLILVLLSKRAKVNGIVYLFTVIGSMLVLALVGAFVIDVATEDGTDQPSTAKGIGLLVMGGLLALVAWRNWRNREDRSVPKVFDQIGRMGPGAVFVLAVGVAFFNPKNLIMLLAAGGEAGATGATTSDVVVALVLFTLVATLPFSVAVGYMVFGGAAAAERLETARVWLTTRNRLIMAVVLGVLAVVLVAKGITALG